MILQVGVSNFILQEGLAFAFDEIYLDKSRDFLAGTTTVLFTFSLSFINPVIETKLSSFKETS